MNTTQLYDEYMLPLAAKGTEQLAVVSGKGCTVRDDRGREYLDCFAGIAVVNAGHNHPRIIAAAQKQMEKLIHCCSYVYKVPAVGELAKKLAEITPGDLKKSFMCNSGAEAVEGAMRLAKQYTGRLEMIALGFSFHGRTIGTLSLTGHCARKKGNGPFLSGVAFAPTPYCYRCPFRLDYPGCDIACAHALKDTILQQTAGAVAAFIAEPLLGEGGIIVPPDEYFKIATDIVHEHGALFIADEVQSGFGRTGKFFAIEHYPDVDVDIMMMAKGIANGFPLGAFTAKAEISEAMAPGDHLSTFGGSPVSCAAAIENISVLHDENLIDSAAERGRQLLASLNELKEKYALIGDVRGKGLMIGIELVRDRKTKEPAADEAKAIRAALLGKGILIGVGGAYGNVVRLQPPLCITEAQCARVTDALEKALQN